MRDSCHVLKVINKTTKEDKGYITFADSTTSSLPFISSSTDGNSPGPLMMKALAGVAPSWYTQGLACSEGNGLDVERIRNTDLFSQFMEKHPLKQRGSPITSYFSFSSFWDLKIVAVGRAGQTISFTRND